MREFAKPFYRSQAWKITRKAYLHSVGGLCERCLSKGLIVPAELVHHKVPLSPDNIDDEHITLNWDNLQALCRACHADVHEDIYAGRHFPNRLRKRYVIGPNGEVKSRRDPT